MRIVFLSSSSEGVRWFTRYYQQAFPEGTSNAREKMAATLAHLAENPRMGRPVSDTQLRECVIPRTPFFLVYRIARDRIEILRLLDGRANREPGIH